MMFAAFAASAPRLCVTTANNRRRGNIGAIHDDRRRGHFQLSDADVVLAQCLYPNREEGEDLPVTALSAILKRDLALETRSDGMLE